MVCTLGWATPIMVLPGKIFFPGCLDVPLPTPIGGQVNPTIQMGTNGMRTCTEMACGTMLEIPTLKDLFGPVTMCSVVPVK